MHISSADLCKRAKQLLDEEMAKPEAVRDAIYMADLQNSIYTYLKTLEIKIQAYYDR